MGQADSRQGHRWVHISSATTTEVTGSSSVGGRLIRLIINAAVASTITISDVNGTIAVLAASAPVGSYEFDVLCAGRIRIVTAGASDLTAVWE